MKNLFKKPILLLATFGMIALAGCKDDDSEPSLSDLKLEITGLTDLGSEFVYEGWVITAGGPFSTGTFTVNATGAWSASTFEVNSDTLAAATKFVLTIEPKDDTDPKPSKQKLLAGDFSTGSNTATVSTATAPAVGDFSMAAGTFFLRTPTDEAAGTPNNGNDEAGIWFGVPGTPPTAGLTLPILPDGWTYEGWVVVTTASGDPFPISTGTFKEFDVVDSGNPYSGTENAGPPIPGEDFLTTNKTDFPAFPLDLRGGVTVISVEPVPDNSPAPFLLKPLKANIPSDAETAPTVHNFDKNLDSLPKGTATR